MYQSVNPGIHPLTSSSLWSIRIMQYLFHFWIWPIVKNDVHDLNDYPNIPEQLSTKRAYDDWMMIYEYRVANDLPVNTMHLIYHTERKRILFCLFGSIVDISCTAISFSILICCILPLFMSSNIIISDIAFYALLIFIVCCIKSICGSLCHQLTAQIVYRITSSLRYLLFKKVLSLSYNAYDKQRINNIIGSDIQSIEKTIRWFLLFGSLFILWFLFTIIAMLSVIGFAALFGVIFMLFIGVPLQLLFGAKLSSYTKQRKKAADKRVQLITELIRGIRFLKCNASEMALMNNINRFRTKELQCIRKRNLYFSFLILGNFLIPSLMLIISIIGYVEVFHHELDSTITLLLVMILSVTSISVKAIPILAGWTVSLFVFMKRIDEYLNKDDNNNNNNIDDNNNNIDIAIKCESFDWYNHKSDIAFSLKDIDLQIKRGQLVAIVGGVGSGKTSLIQAILGEMHMNITPSSYFVVNKDISYCSQSPYIRNGTLKENIIMNNAFDKEKYRQCIIASALHSDLKQLPNYDLTQIGDEGVTLSGGQQMRVAFARTIYNESTLYIYDEPLSSVDVFVGKEMFFNGIIKHIKKRNKTCLMVITSHLNLLKYFDEIIIMDHGQIKLQKSTNHLFRNNNISFQTYRHLLPNINTLKNHQPINDEKQNEFEFDFGDDSNILHRVQCNDLDPPSLETYKLFLKSSLSTFDYKRAFYDCDDDIHINGSDKGWRLTIMICILCITFILQSLSPLCNVWILFWNQDMENNAKFEKHFTDKSNWWYLTIWFILLSTVSVATSFLMHYVSNICIRASQSIHSNVLCNILRSKTLFFDVTPRGALINLFSSDTNGMDIDLPMIIFQFIIVWVDIFGMFVLILFITPISIVVFILLIFPILYYLFPKYHKTYYSFIVFQKKSLSPILTLFNEMCPNLDSVRAYRLQHFFLNMMIHKIEYYVKCGYYAGSVAAWFRLNQEMLINATVMMVILISAINEEFNHFNESNSALLTLSIWYILVIQMQFQQGLTLCSLLDRDFLNVKRLLYYCDPAVASDISESKQTNASYTIKPATKWPTSGTMKLSSLKLRYRANFDIVLDINTQIRVSPGTKIGICGRTGSGKSSMLVSIFRLFEPIIKESDVVIDKLDIYKLGLFDLRSNLSIILQTPILFYGNLRFNLDPFDEYQDTQIWNALRDVQLFQLINSRENGLLCKVDENGSNFSFGEKQLICFCRAILKKSKVVFMDEATSSLDQHTDLIIQKLIKSDKFKNVTIVTIAHRLKTILDYDYVLVLENGHVKEYDSPNNLLKTKNSTFSALVKSHDLS